MADLVLARPSPLATPVDAPETADDITEAFRWAHEAWQTLRGGDVGVVVPVTALAAMLRAIQALDVSTDEHEFPIERGPAGGPCRRCGISPMANDAVGGQTCSGVVVDTRSLLELLRHR